MQKLVLICECGERMQVPRSAIGRSGLCPSCGRKIHVRADNTRPVSRMGAFRSEARPHASGNGPTEEDKLRFGKAVDLYVLKRYGEALAVFNSLQERYPGNPEVENARALCAKALMRQPTLAIEDKRKPVEGEKLDARFVRNFIMDMMLNGSSEKVQLQAAELACRILGMLGQHRGGAGNGAENYEMLSDSEVPAECS